MVSDVTRIVQRMQRKREEKRRASVREELESKYGAGTPEYYDAYNRYLYGSEQWEFIKSSSNGRSEEGYYVSTTKAEVPAPQEAGPGPSIDVTGAASAPSITRIASPQETISSNTLMSPALFREEQDTLEAGPMGVDAPGGSTREEILSEKRQKAGYPGYQDVYVELPNPALAGTLTGRIISAEETISVESEAEMAEERSMGRAQLEAPREISRDVSRMVVGDLESYPMRETAPRAVAAATEWAITLPAETLLSPVSMTEAMGQARQEGVIRFMGEEIKAISRDPFGAGVQAGLTAGLIAIPAASLVRGRALRGSPGRTSPRLSVELGPQDIQASGIRYFSDFLFEPGGKGIRGRGVVAAATEGAESLVSVTSETVPAGKGYRTTVEARRLGRSKMDLITPEEIRGTMISQDTGPGKSSYNAIAMAERLEGQVNLEGMPSPRAELTASSGEISRIGDIDVGFGRRASIRSLGNMEISDVTHVSGSKLLYEMIEGPRVRRKTFAREAQIPTKQLRDQFFGKDLEGLGSSQATVRFDMDLPPGAVAPRSGKGVVMAERSMLQAAQSFLKTSPSRARAPQPIPARSIRSRAPEMTRPVSGLGALPQTARPAQEEIQIVRYPPGEGPSMLEAPREMDLGMASASRVDRMLGRVLVRDVFRRSRGSGQVSGQDLVLGMDLRSLQGSMNLQSQAQALGLRQAQLTRQRQRARPDIMLPIEPPNMRQAFDVFPSPVPTGRSVLGGPVPPLIVPGGGMRPPRGGGGSWFGRGYRYTPTIAGWASGQRVRAPPRGVLTGLEIRYPVQGGNQMPKKKKKKGRR